MIISFLGMTCISILVILWLRLYDRKAFSGKVHVGFPLFIGLGWFQYTFFFMLEKFFKNDLTNSDAQFIFDSNIALLSMVGGAVFAEICMGRLYVRSRVTIDYLQQQSQNPKINSLGIYIATAFVVVAVHFYIQIVFGGWTVYFTQKYGEYLVEGINSVTAVIPMLCASYILVFNSPLLLTNKKSARLVISSSITLIVIFFLGGNRNIAMMLILSLIWAKWYGRQINIFYLLTILVCSIVVGAINAVLREYGVLNIMSGQLNFEELDIGRFILAISEGEFGTMARVSKYYSEFDFKYDFGFGKSYLIDPIINLIPTLVYPGRPDTIAVQFTEQYWGASKDMGALIGLGFSPIVEAKINLQSLWFLCFFIMGFICRIAVMYLFKKKQAFGFLFMGSLSVASLNFFRIDFAIYFKFSIIIMLLGSLLLTFCNVLNRIKIK